MRKNRVLIIDRDLQTCKDIKYNVDSATTEAYYTLTVREGLAELASKEYDLVILVKVHVKECVFPRNGRHGGIKDATWAETHAYPDLVHVVGAGR